MCIAPQFYLRVIYLNNIDKLEVGIFFNIKEMLAKISLSVIPSLSSMRVA